MPDMNEPDHALSKVPDSGAEPVPLLEPLTDTAYGYSLPGRRLAIVTVVCILLAIVCTVAPLLPQARPIVVQVCLALIPLIAVALLAVIPLASIGKGIAPVVPLFAGWAVVIGGAAIDIYATVSHSPDLAQEMNPVLRGLLDNGVSLQRVYLYGAVLQALFLALTMVLWLGFLKHISTLAATMPQSGSLLAYFKAGTGGRELSYRQWLCPLSYSELPWAYHLTWWCGFAFVGVSAYRFYLALEWYDIAPRHTVWIRLIAPTVMLFLTCWFYAAWLRAVRARMSLEESISLLK
jgi:hypothetical protein